MSPPLSTQALVVRPEQQSLSLEEVVIVDLKPDEILVEIVTSGICQTDLLAMDGILPMPSPGVLGHEGTGRISKVGEGVHHLSPGDQVMLSYSSCGSCDHCRSQHTSYCEGLQARNSSGARPDGSSALISTSGDRRFGHWFGQSFFSKYAVVNASCAVRLAPEIDLATLPRRAPVLGGHDRRQADGADPEDSKACAGLHIERVEHGSRAGHEATCGACINFCWSAATIWRIYDISKVFESCWNPLSAPTGRGQKRRLSGSAAGATVVG
ncbi:GroES-like protein [Aspergillus japonicus CBS 114.51]|uniref:GroES-like protein n=1 Tax=Aspergillus japonicus CBS 114.51 TaxID=1448312 RepID=A0A8T8XF05_ASPJA|nr:GroES-like protein [Aspergillus japonicus CBS 114.51]RAH85852.1 GroES-like protein [Aspergillus japonicus CBS 114.51]